MSVINQFYDERLEMGYSSLDHERDHNCGSGLYSKDYHAVWSDVPQFGEYAEKKVGISYANMTEVQIIERILEDLY